jgi:hypothetical protein
MRGRPGARHRQQPQPDRDDEDQRLGDHEVRDTRTDDHDPPRRAVRPRPGTHRRRDPERHRDDEGNREANHREKQRRRHPLEHHAQRRLGVPDRVAEVAGQRPGQEQRELDGERLVEAVRPPERLDDLGRRRRGQERPSRVGRREEEGMDDERDADQDERVPGEAPADEPEHARGGGRRSATARYGATSTPTTGRYPRRCGCQSGIVGAAP